jgi:hypothetical protein
MLKLTSLAIGLLSIIAIAPQSEAMTANAAPASIERSANNLHSQIILKVGDRNRGYSRGGISQRRRELELRREREEARRRDRFRGRRDRSEGMHRRDR